MGRVIWLASYPKSGNTWVRAFLHNLLENSDSPFDINEMSGLTASDGALERYREIDRRPPERWSAEDIDRMRYKVQETIARSQPGIVFCKTHHILATIRGVATVNPHVSAGAVYIVRNPLDVAISFADFSHQPIDTVIARMAAENYEIPTSDDFIKTPLGSWSQHVDSWTAKAKSKVHVMRYEDMAASPSKAFAGLAAYLNMRPSRDRLRRAIKHASFKSLRAQEDCHGFVERPKAQKQFFRKGQSGQWRKQLTAEQVSKVVAAHGFQMERFGYLPEQDGGTGATGREG